MSRRKAAENCQILPWLSGNQNNREKRFLQIGNTLLFDEKYKTLRPAARQLYVCMAMEACGKSQFEFPHRAAKKYGFSGTSFDNYARELQQAGFIEKIKQEEQFAVARYQFTFAWKQKSHPNLGRADP